MRPNDRERMASAYPAPRLRSKRLLSVGAKLAVATVGVLLVVSTFLYFELTGRERHNLLASKEQAAAMVADLLAASVGAPLDFEDNESLDSELANLKNNRDLVCAVIYSKAGVEVGKLDRGACADVHMPTDDDLGKTHLSVDRLALSRAVVAERSGRVGRLVLVFSLSRDNEAFESSRARIFWLSFALAAGTAVLLLAVAQRQIVVPLAKLTSAARRIGRGEFQTRIDAVHDDEIGDLALAFDRMREGLADREQRLAAATRSLRELFDHMAQGICAFGPDGTVQGEFSRQATVLFGRRDLTGVRVLDVLYPDGTGSDLDTQALHEWIAMAFDVPLGGWEEFAALAPREIAVRRPGTSVLALELEFLPIVTNGRIERVMLLASDVSEKRKLERAARTKEEEYALKMAAMRRLISGGGQVFVDFMEATRWRIERCLEIVGRDAHVLRTGEIDELFRHVHTVKGEARAFDLRDLEFEAAKLEDQLDELRARARGEGFATTHAVHDELLARLARADEAIARGREVFVAASPIGRAALDQVTVQRPDIQDLTDLAERRRDPELDRLVARLDARPLGSSTASLVDMVPTWSEREGRLARLEVDGREVRVPAKVARVLGGVLTHLIRNAIAHGIEPPRVREGVGKPRFGTIRVTAEPGLSPDVGPTITFQDDGRGLDAGAICRRAAQLAVAPTGDARETSPSELVFVAGLSTQEGAGALAGRGVGLSAVRADLEGVGYAIEARSEPGKSTCFIMRPRATAEPLAATSTAEPSS